MKEKVFNQSCRGSGAPEYKLHGHIVIQIAYKLASLLQEPMTGKSPTSFCTSTGKCSGRGKKSWNFVFYLGKSRCGAEGAAAPDPS